EPRHGVDVVAVGARQIVCDRSDSIGAGVESTLVRVEEEIGHLERRLVDVDLQLTRLAEPAARCRGGARSRGARRAVVARGAPDAGGVAAPARLLLDAGVVLGEKQRRARAVVDARGPHPAPSADTERAARAGAPPGAGRFQGRGAVPAETARPGPAVAVHGACRGVAVGGA